MHSTIAKLAAQDAGLWPPQTPTCRKHLAARSLWPVPLFSGRLWLLIASVFVAVDAPLALMINYATLDCALLGFAATTSSGTLGCAALGCAVDLGPLVKGPGQERPLQTGLRTKTKRYKKRCKNTLQKNVAYSSYDTHCYLQPPTISHRPNM